uniref:Predicted protein n=1 Tax=Hordeum vulgare subsp. vulgare TaxID=112509 RepID=F2DCM0_HORVV|nr:predicted protein [Hordeum vulgare subsp. vulgare]
MPHSFHSVFVSSSQSAARPCIVTG